MYCPRLIAVGLSVLASIASIHDAHGQNLPESISFSISGRFRNGVEESFNSLLITDNTLTDGYASGADLHDVPAALATTGPVGSAFFQWGIPSAMEDYPHASALWFQPLTVTNAVPEQEFEIGYLYYRNGTIQSSTGASAADLRLTFTLPDKSTIVTNFTSSLINTPNTGTAAEMADVVSLDNHAAPLGFTDNKGHTYYLDLSFKVDDDTLNNSLANTTEFRAYEGTVSRAEMFGRFTIAPAQAVPEPATALLGLLGSLFFVRRKR